MKATENDNQLFVEYLESFVALPKDAVDMLVSLTDVVEYRRRQMVTSKGEVEKYMYFVLEGVQRGFHIKDDKDITIAFTHFPSFSGIPESLLTNTPSEYYLETLTTSRLLRLPYKKVDAILMQSHALEHLMRKIVEKTLVGVMTRSYQLQAFSMEEKFSSFIKRSGHLINKIPHKYIASYLGMDATNFSKLLHKVKV